MKEPIILIGGGGHCISCIDVVEAQGKFTIAGIVDVPEKKGQKVFGYDIRWADADIAELVTEFRYFLITLGQIESAKKRIEMVRLVSHAGGQFPTIISPEAHVSSRATIGVGTIIFHGCAVNAGASIGNHCIVNTGAIVEHGVNVSNFSHLASGSVLNGNCEVGSEVFIGSNATVLQEVFIKDEVIIGAGSIVTKSLYEKGTYIGAPATRVFKSETSFSRR